MTQIMIFGAEWCSNCKVLKNWLEQHNIKHDYIDVEKDGDGEYRYWLASRGVRGLPAASVNGEVIVGHDVEGIINIIKEELI